MTGPRRTPRRIRQAWVKSLNITSDSRKFRASTATEEYTTVRVVADHAGQ